MSLSPSTSLSQHWDRIWLAPMPMRVLPQSLFIHMNASLWCLGDAASLVSPIPPGSYSLSASKSAHFPEA